MFIEIERKFKLVDTDHDIIKTNLELVSRSTVEDIYLDLPDFSLILNKIKFRIRNWKRELKIRVWKISSEEYYEKDAIEKLASLEIPYENITEKVCTIITKREKYTWVYDWHDYLVDLDQHWGWNRYEIEVQCQTEQEWFILIENITESLWLTAVEITTKNEKVMSNVKYQNPSLYKRLLEA